MALQELVHQAATIYLIKQMYVLMKVTNSLQIHTPIRLWLMLCQKDHV